MSLRSSCLGFALMSVCAAGVAGASDTPKVMLDVASAVDGTHQGSTVLWGGKILGRYDESGQTCLEIGASTLGIRDGRPREAGALRGQRFYACSDAGFDESKYAKGQLATVAGTLGAVQERRLRGGSCATVYEGAGSRKVDGDDGCLIQIPVVVVADSRAWLGGLLTKRTSIGPMSNP